MLKYLFLFVAALVFYSCNNPSLVVEGQGIDLLGIERPANTGQEVDQLFSQLKVASEIKSIRRKQSRIRALWADHKDPHIDTLMKQGVEAMYGKDYEAAISLFSKIIQEKPGFAEGWNKRATVFYMKGEYQASMQDIKKTLKLENRHFGALSGMASIYIMRGENEEALHTYQRIQQLIPQLTEVNQSIEDLRTRLGYRQI